MLFVSAWGVPDGLQQHLQQQSRITFLELATNAELDAVEFLAVFHSRMYTHAVQDLLLKHGASSITMVSFAKDGYKGAATALLRIRGLPAEKGWMCRNDGVMDGKFIAKVEELERQREARAVDAEFNAKHAAAMKESLSELTNRVQGVHAHMANKTDINELRVESVISLRQEQATVANLQLALKEEQATVANLQLALKEEQATVANVQLALKKEQAANAEMRKALKSAQAAGGTTLVNLDHEQQRGRRGTNMIRTLNEDIKSRDAQINNYKAMELEFVKLKLKHDHTDKVHRMQKDIVRVMNVISKHIVKGAPVTTAATVARPPAPAAVAVPTAGSAGVVVVVAAARYKRQRREIIDEPEECDDC